MYFIALNRVILAISLASLSAIAQAETTLVAVAANFTNR